MVFGSPAQRATTGGSTREEATRRYVDGLASVAPHALARGVTILVEALPKGAMRRSADARRSGRHCARDRQPRHPDHVRHAQRRGRSGAARGAGRQVLRRDPPRARERNWTAGYCGTGTYDFRPVLDTLRRRNYKGWVSLEAFDFKPGAETIANESLRYLETRISQLPS